MVLVECVIMSNCRLCHSKPGQYDIKTDKKLIKEIYECIKVKVNDKSMNMLPHSVCEECKKTVKDFFSYKQHVKKIDQSLRKILLSTESKFNDDTSRSLDVFKCTECPATFSFQNLFNNHIKSHSIDNWHCVKCKEYFKNSEQYETHVCTEYSLKSNVQDHILESEIEKESLEIKSKKSSEGDTEDANILKQLEDHKCLTEPSDCKICQEKLNTTQDKKNHKRKYVCPWKNCQKILNSAYTLKTHELKHQGKRSFLCVTCGKGFITKNSLTCHEKIHLDIKGYICKLCNIGFSVRSNLRAHEKKHHEGIRFYCSQCTKAFVSKCSLERHERIHTGIKDFQCESCPSAFYTNKELMKHQRYHQGLRLHKCDECFKTFFERHHLVIHLRSHTGERPYVCKIPNCGKSFMESQKLKRHHNAKHAQT